MESQRTFNRSVLLILLWLLRLCDCLKCERVGRISAMLSARHQSDQHLFELPSVLFQHKGRGDELLFLRCFYYLNVREEFSDMTFNAPPREAFERKKLGLRSWIEEVLPSDAMSLQHEVVEETVDLVDHHISFTSHDANLVALQPQQTCLHLFLWETRLSVNLEWLIDLLERSSWARRGRSRGHTFLVWVAI